MQLKKVLLGTALAVVPSAGYAADLPARAAAPAPAAIMASGANWTGFYVGVTAGMGRTAGLHTSTSPDLNPVCDGDGTSCGDLSGAGALFGLTAGYNHQFGSIVLGVEADYVWTSKMAIVNGGDTVTNNGTAETAGLGTIRARAGLALGNTLVYLTAGVASVHTKMAFVGYATDKTGSLSQRKTSFVVGAGLEQALGNGWSFKVEGLYTPKQKFSLNGENGSDSPKTWTVNKDNIIARVGLNYRFGAAAAPVMARY